MAHGHDWLARSIGCSRAVGVLLRAVEEGERRLVQLGPRSADICHLPDVSVGDPDGELLTRDGDLAVSSQLEVRDPLA